MVRKKQRNFTPEEDRQLVEYRDAGMIGKQIALLLGRGETTISRRYVRIKREEEIAKQQPVNGEIRPPVVVPDSSGFSVPISKTRSRWVPIEKISVALINKGDYLRAVDIAKCMELPTDTETLIKLEEILEGRHFKSHVKCGRKYYSHR